MSPMPSVLASPVLIGSPQGSEQQQQAYGDMLHPPQQQAYGDLVTPSLNGTAKLLMRMETLLMVNYWKGETGHNDGYAWGAK